MVCCTVVRCSSIGGMLTSKRTLSRTSIAVAKSKNMDGAINDKMVHMEYCVHAR